MYFKSQSRGGVTRLHGLYCFDNRVSPAARGTKKHVYLLYRKAIPFWFYLVPLGLVNVYFCKTVLL